MALKKEPYESEQFLVSEHPFRNLADNAVDAIINIDYKGRIVYWNKAAEQIFGYNRSEILGKDVLILVPKRFHKASRIGRIFARLIDIDWTQFLRKTFELTGVRKTGEEFPIELSIGTWKTKQGRFFTSIIRDITERKKVQEELKKKDAAIRKAYVDVFSAVTGGKLIIMTKDELEKELGKPVTDSFSIKSYEELAKIRRLLRDKIKRYFTHLENPEDIILAASEAVTNAVKHAGSGYFQIFKKHSTAQMLISDHGPGINFSALPKATLLGGYSTKQTLGMGFTVMLEFSDRILLSTEPGNTLIVLELYAK